MRTSTTLASTALALLLVACGGDDTQETAADALQQAAEAMQSAAEQMSGEGDSDAEPMTAEELQERLPDELAGLERTSTERQSTGMGGVNMAMATATYAGDGGELEVSLMSGPGVMAGPALAFTMVEFDRTTEDGYERTIRVDGRPGMQSYEEDGDDRRTEMTVLVNNSLLLRLEAEGMTMEQVEDAFDELDPDSMN